MRCRGPNRLLGYDYKSISSVKRSSSVRLMVRACLMNRNTWSIVVGSSPNVCILLTENFEQIQMRWVAVSCTSSSQKRQKGGVEKSSLFWKWLRLLWPVINRVRGLRTSISSLKRCWPCKWLSANKVIKLFVLWLILEDVHLRSCLVVMWSRILFLKDSICGR